MDYTEIMNAIKSASLFDLYRLNVAIRHEMENPERIEKLRLSFKKGDIVSYFNTKSNTLQQAKVLQKNIKFVLVENLQDHKRWNVRYFALNLEQVKVDIQNAHGEKLSKNTLKVGDIVGFNEDDKTVAGVITKLNPKTVSIVTIDHRQWRVYYSSLYRVIDADIVNQFDPKQLSC
jgi:hypothetical protein